MKYLWDTNIAIYYLQKQFPDAVEHIVDTFLTESQLVISVISEIELLCWKNASDDDLKAINEFINDCVVIELEQSIKLKAVEIRKKYNIKLPDAVIAASAINYDLILVTRNERDFAQIEGLKFINPFNIN